VRANRRSQSVRRRYGEGGIVKKEAWFGAVVLTGVVGVFAGAERAAAAAEGHGAEENDYGREGVLEFGGSLGVGWSRDLFSVSLSPTVGWFVRDRIELSVLIGIEYANARLSDGTRDSTSTGSVLFEPSYHLPVSDVLLVFAGLGAGVAYNGSHPAFDLAPRVGLNIDVGRSGVFTPAISVPILLGKEQGGTADDPSSVLVGLQFQAGFTTTF
jgi:hypothetical protein